MCFILNISLMNIAPTSEFCVFKSMWRSWRRLWLCSYLYCAICMVYVSNGVESVVWRQIISHWSNYSDVTWASWGLKSTGACCEWNPPVCRGFSSQRTSNGEDSCILTWGTIMMRTHYQQQCWRHDMDTLSASPFVSRIRRSPLVTHAINQWCSTINRRRVDDVMLMWCHYNDKWAVNFNVLKFFETIVYKNWESLNCPVSLWFEICALESVGRFDVAGGTVLSL